MAKFSPAAFLRDVKQEIAKITWPTRKEATQMTFVVMVVCLLLAVFFFFVDGLSMALIGIILGV
jgi:preprotein translocase subunit SecE